MQPVAVEGQPFLSDVRTSHRSRLRLNRSGSLRVLKFR